MRERSFGRIINISSINGQKGQMGPGQLLGGQGRRYRLHQGAGAGERRAKASPSTSSRRAISPPRWCMAVPKEVLENKIIAADPGRPPRPTGGDRALRRVSRLRRCRLHHRRRRCLPMAGNTWRELLSPAMIWVPRQYRRCAVDLFEQKHANELMRQRHRAEGDGAIGALA